LFGCSDL